ncbi:MAG TPA: ankyrin repeat domain-containing protein [Silvibacterium sp.]|nr:ankyrin repeat domain-containing protein [Silvibacterium sp.]
MSQHLLNMIRRGQAEEIAGLVADAPEAARARDAQGVSMLMWSIYTRQPGITGLLRARAGELDVFEAAALGDCERLREILAGNAMQVWAVSADGWAPLHLAAAFAGPDAVRLLLEHGAHAHQVSHNPQRNQALHAAIALGDSAEVVALLLEAGADVNATQAGGFAPLHQAAAAGKRDLAALLLQNGARRDVRCDQGKLPVEYARERGYSAVVELLV